MSGPERQVFGSQENVNVQDENGLGPPKPPRSAFVCFSDAKRGEIMRRLDLKDKNDTIEILAEEWRQLSHSERAFWDEEARNDKVRFVREKADYKGPWLVPKRRAKKHPLAPKRPMSAFLKFSQKRRATVKERNPDMSNTDVSRLLGEMWRNASAAERAPYIDQEELERAAYKVEIQKWREEQAKLDAESRTSHRDVVYDVADDKTSSPTQQEHVLPFQALRESVVYASFDYPEQVDNEDPLVVRSHDHHRDVFRTHPARSYGLRRTEEERSTRHASYYSSSYRLNGSYHHDQSLRPYQHYQDPMSVPPDFEDLDRTQGVRGSRVGQTSHFRVDTPQQVYNGRGKYTPNNSIPRHYGYYHHPHHQP